MARRYKSTWHKMRELVILSLNIIFIKDLLQAYERGSIKTEYLNLPAGPFKVLIDDAQRRKHFLQRRVKDLLEDILNDKRVTVEETQYAFIIDLEHACITKKQMEKGYALFTNVRDLTFSLNLRNGSLLPIRLPEATASDRNMMAIEYISRHEGSVYKYFDIDLTDPLRNNLRY